MATTCATDTRGESACLTGGDSKIAAVGCTYRNSTGSRASSPPLGSPSSWPTDTVPEVRVHPEDQQFHVGVALIGFLCAFSVGVFGALLIAVGTGYANQPSNQWPLWVQAVSNIPQWIGLFGVCWFASRTWGTSDLRRDYGLAVRLSDVVGIPVGVVVQLVFVPAMYWVLGPLYRALFHRTQWSWFDVSKLEEPAKNLTSKGQGAFGVALLVVMVVVGAPLFEELFFRGLVLRSFAARYNDGWALIGSAVMFGLIHFQPLQLPALIMFGLIVGYAAQRTGRLGLGMAIHAGFNLTAVVVNLLHR